jgi:hypothetical protein
MLAEEIKQAESLQIRDWKFSKRALCEDLSTDCNNSIIL